VALRIASVLLVAGLTAGAQEESPPRSVEIGGYTFPVAPGPEWRFSLKELHEALRDDDHAVRHRVLLILAHRLETQSALAGIVGCLYDETDLVSQTAGVILGSRRESRPAIPFLLELAEDEDPTMRFRGLQSLRVMFGPDEPRLRADDAALLRRTRSITTPALPEYAQWRARLKRLGPLSAEALLDDVAYVRWHASRAALRAGPKGESILVGGLTSKRVRVRRLAALTLPHMELTPISTRALVAALKDTDWTVRENTARALGKQGPRAAPALDALCEMFLDWAYPTFGDAILAIDPERHAVIVQEALGHVSPEVRRNALARVKHLADYDISFHLINLLHDEIPFVQSAAEEAVGTRGVGQLRALPVIYEREVEGVLLPADWRWSYHLRTFDRACAASAPVSGMGATQMREFLAASRTMRGAKDRRGRPRRKALARLVRDLASGSHERRIRAANMTAEFGPAAKAAVPKLIVMLQSESPYEVGRAAYALGKIEPDAPRVLSALGGALEHESAYARMKAAMAFVEAREAAGPFLQAALDSPRVRTRMIALTALTHRSILARPVVPRLRRMLKEERREGRRLAIWLLGEMGPPGYEALPDLKALVGSDERWLVDDVLVALGRLAKEGDGVYEILIEALPRKAAVDGLGHMGPDAEAAIPALEKVWREQRSADASRRGGGDDWLRAKVIAALVRIGQPGIERAARLMRLELPPEGPVDYTSAVAALEARGTRAARAALWELERD
jgi:HEAT repeat protein